MTLTPYAKFSEIETLLNSGELTLCSLVDGYLSNINEQKHLNAFLEVYEKEAKQAAIAIDEKLKIGTAGKLAGMIIGLKDVLCHKDHKVQASSKILNGFQSMFSATAVQRLLDEDAIIIGRLNCDEFAMGASNENSAFGPVLNFADNTRVSGGSSGGSAVAVQANLCHAALGTDTGGSVRQPASFCGVYGLKPTYSRLSRYGLLAYASSFDTIGTLTRSIEDAALLMSIMAGKDEYDSTVSSRPVPDFPAELNRTGNYKIAYLQDCLENKAIQPSIKEKSMDWIDQLRSKGHTVEPVSFPYLDFMVPTYYLLTTAEASANLARYDGIRFGYRVAGKLKLEDVYKKSRTQGFGPEVKRRIMLGTFVLCQGYYEAFFTKAQKVRRIIQTKTAEILKDYDFIFSPTTPNTAFKIGEMNENPIQMYLQDIFTVQASLAGYPAISFPAGKDENGLPIGFQLMSKPFSENLLMSFVNQINSVT